MITSYFETENSIKLDINIYMPKNKPQALVPCVVFIFGGGWNDGSINQFAPQAEYFSSRGMIAVTPQYRTKTSHNVPVEKCLIDVKNALLWIIKNSNEYNIDIKRIAVCGGSAGGHLAVMTSIDKTFPDVSDIPKAHVLLNPVLDTSSDGYGEEHIGKNSIRLSPLHRMNEAIAPTLVMHGTSDSIVRYTQAENFAEKAVLLGGECVLKPYEGREHGFFNRTVSEKDFCETTVEAYSFLQELWK